MICYTYLTWLLSAKEDILKVDFWKYAHTALNFKYIFSTSISFPSHHQHPLYPVEQDVKGDRADV